MMGGSEQERTTGLYGNRFKYDGVASSSGLDGFWCDWVEMRHRISLGELTKFPAWGIWTICVQKYRIGDDE